MVESKSHRTGEAGHITLRHCTDAVVTYTAYEDLCTLTLPDYDHAIFARKRDVLRRVDYPKRAGMYTPEWTVRITSKTTQTKLNTISDKNEFTSEESGG